jgi:uncharacterized protein YeaO (DUF488 family)
MRHQIYLSMTVLDILGAVMLLGRKRIYDKVELTDGTRILIDGLWPRGVRKSTAHIDKWMKEVAPSMKLREWFNHDASKWDEFMAKYTKELEKNPAVDELLGIVAKSDVTLIYASRDTEHNNAVVLSEFIKKKSA